VADFDTKPSSGEFETTLQIDEGSGPQSFTGRGSTKKAAEANAAVIAIQALHIPAERAPSAAVSPVTTDPLMYLKEREDRGAPPAVYSRPRQRGDNWTVDVTILGNDGRPRTVSGSARSIKTAKREAAQKAREILEE
jgi:dsRNA-specific ribonuclease